MIIFSGTHHFTQNARNCVSFQLTNAWESPLDLIFNQRVVWTYLGNYIFNYSWMFIPWYCAFTHHFSKIIRVPLEIARPIMLQQSSVCVITCDYVRWKKNVRYLFIFLNIRHKHSSVHDSQCTMMMFLRLSRWVCCSFS